MTHYYSLYCNSGNLLFIPHRKVFWEVAANVSNVATGNSCAFCGY